MSTADTVIAAHSAGFLRLVADTLGRIREVPAGDLPVILARDPDARLIDVREESEYAAGHIGGAEPLSKGVIERDIEKLHPDPGTPLYLYCGGGFRSALAADNLQKMGYTNVYSIRGGWRALKELLPVE
jgi:rhodanese-related sulfurtransferase